MGKGIGDTERGGDGWKTLGMYVGVGKDIQVENVYKAQSVRSSTWQPWVTNNCTC